MFDRLIKLIGRDSLEKIQSKKILLIGVGGVGSSALEALVRNGFNNITIIDFDTIDISNLNRQLITNNDNIGSSKAKEACLRAKSINPSINIQGIEKRLEIDSLDDNDLQWSMNYTELIAPCVQMIQQQQKEIEELKEMIKALQK